MQQNGEKTFFSVFLLFCQRFKKQGSVPFFSFIFRFVKRSQLFICFLKHFLLSRYCQTHRNAL